MRYMHWTRWEQAIARKLTRYPRSTTPRERTLLLLAIRLAFVGAALSVPGLAVVSIGGRVGWYPLTVAGVVLFAAGLTFLVSSMATGAYLTIMYGD